MYGPGMGNDRAARRRLVTVDSRGRITLPFGKPNWRYQLTENADGTFVLVPLGPRSEPLPPSSTT